MGKPDYDATLRKIHELVAGEPEAGKVADYIPPLAKVDPDRFAMCVQTLDGERYTCGDASVRFSTQSVSKVFTAAMVLSHRHQRRPPTVGPGERSSPMSADSGSWNGRRASSCAPIWRGP